MANKKPMKKFKRYDEGGSVEEAMAKQRGLDISNKEAPVGFFERLRAGNIDEPGTEAYNRFGAGRGRDRGESVSVNQPMPAAPAAPAMPAASSRPLSDPMYSDYGSSTGAGAAGTSETIKPTRQVMNKPTLPAKPTATPVPPLRNTGPDRSSLINKPSLNPNFSNEGRTKPAPAASAASQIPGQSAKAPQGTKIDSSETSRNIENAMLATGAGGVGLAGLYKLGKMMKGGREAAGKVAPYLKELGTSAPKKLLQGPRKASKSADVTDVVPKSTSYRSLTGKAREDARANEARDKLMKSDFVKKPKKGLDESDTTGGAVGFKRGGKMKKYASGGMVSSASRRADGIATKGKTRCKIC
jgi:hypothetical protein